MRRAGQRCIPDAVEHSLGQLVINHGLVVYRLELRAHRLSDEVQPGARAAGQDDALACHAAAPLLFGYPLAVCATLNTDYLLRAYQVLLHGLADAGLKGFGRLPAEFPLDIARVEAVAPVVAGAVLHVGDLRFVAGDALGRNSSSSAQTVCTERSDAALLAL